jgi:hypothetical protein
MLLLLHLLRIILKVYNIEGAQSDKRCEVIRVDLVNQWRSIIVALLQKVIGLKGLLLNLMPMPYKGQNT